MTNFIPKCTFEYTISNVKSITKEIYTPIFATTADLYWQLEFSKASQNTCSVYLLAIKNSEYTETFWSSRNKLKVKLYLKDPNTQKVIDEQLFSELNLTEDDPSIGSDGIRSGPKLPDDVIVGVQFSKNKVLSTSQEELPGTNTPDDLVEAWATQLDRIENDDVRFDVQDKTIYASSVVLSKRSEYFQKFFQGRWAESQVGSSPLKNSESQVGSPPKNSESSSITYHIEVTDFEAEVFYEMLRFLYTNQIRFDHLAKYEISPLQVFRIADKYLLPELRQKAKGEALEKLDVNNVAEGLFTIAYKWPELKEPFMDFFVENISEVRKTSGFDAILTNPSAYPGFKDLFNEILTTLTTTET